MDEWQHRIDVGARDLEEDGDQPNHIDITIRAFVKKGVSHAKPETIYEQAAKDKRRDHPQKDIHGRHRVQGQLVPFVMSTFGGMGPEAQKFIRRCSTRNPERTEHMKDVLAAQHAHWIADRLLRAMGARVLYAKPLSPTGTDKQPEAMKKKSRRQTTSAGSGKTTTAKPKPKLVWRPKAPTNTSV